MYSPARVAAATTVINLPAVVKAGPTLLPIVEVVIVLLQAHPVEVPLQVAAPEVAQLPAVVAAEVVDPTLFLIK